MWGSLHKNSKSIGNGELPGEWTHLRTRTVIYPSSMGTEDPVLGTLSDFTLCTSLSIYSSVFLIISLNKLVDIASVSLSLWAALEN